MSNKTQEDYAPGNPHFDQFAAHLRDTPDAVLAETLVWVAEWHEKRKGWQSAAVIRDAARRLRT